MRLRYKHNELIAGQRLKYSMAGLVLGSICIVGGITLFLFGVAGATSWSAKILEGESKLLDAAPGAVLFVIGLFIVVVTRYKHRTVGSQIADMPSHRDRSGA